MVNTKNRSTPVVEKREEKCACGCEKCTCESDCKCNCRCCNKTFLKCTTTLFSAALIAGAVLLQPCVCQKPMLQMPMRPDLAAGQFIKHNPKFVADAVRDYLDVKPSEAAAKPEPAKAGSFLEQLQVADAGLIKKIIDDPTNYSLGNPRGKFVIIEFFDYQCGWCKRTNKGLEEAIASKEGKNIRWIPIDTPIFGPASETIARYVLAAGEQGKYSEMHKAVGEDTTELSAARTRAGEAMQEYISKNGLSVETDQEKIQAYSEEVIAREYGQAMAAIGAKVGVDADKMKAAAEGDKIRQKLVANDEFRRALNINGVPMVIIDGRINPGALLGDNLDEVVKLSAKKK